MTVVSATYPATICVQSGANRSFTCAVLYCSRCGQRGAVCMNDLSTVQRPDPVAAAKAAQFVFQPIVSPTSLEPRAFEGLARLPDASGFAGAADLLDVADGRGDLPLADLELLAGAMARFAELRAGRAARLFCNLHPALVLGTEGLAHRITGLARQHALAPADLCLELSPPVTAMASPGVARLAGELLAQGLRVALGGFGRGTGDLESLLQATPHYLKIDRLFTRGISRNARVQAIAGKIIGLGHALGVQTVAERVESEADFRLLRELGCDLMQGFLTGRPDTQLQIAPAAPVVARLRRDSAIPRRIADLLIEVEPLPIGATLADAVARFREGVDLGFLPVTDAGGHVLGAVFEADLNRFLFGEFGTALLGNSGLSHRLDRFMTRCPVSEATASADAIVESFLIVPGAKGIVLTLDGRLAGLLSSHNVLQLISERAVEDARDRNPLTALPGNGSIGRHLEGSAVGQPYCIAFFDFDNFKSFNDVYGFAAGDQIILLFAEILKRIGREHGGFVAHVGGDDFFAGLPLEEQIAEQVARSALAEFRQRAEGLYSEEHLAAGGLRTTDRFGEMRFFPLLRASAVILYLPAERAEFTPAEIIGALAEGKGRAKASASGMHKMGLAALLARRGTARQARPGTGRTASRSPSLAGPMPAAPGLFTAGERPWQASAT